ncbi:fucose-specific lectin [Biscogniauxia mediterranea]|nr:fucose-specific lectin [Biscogniauxia mediterranea]
MGHKRLYYQNTTGHIYEATYDEKSGWDRRSVVVKGDLGSPIAVAASGLDRIRLYYLIGSILQELMWDGSKWEKGSLTGHEYKVDRFSKLAARMVDKEPRVYAQVKNHILEFKYVANFKNWGISHDFGTGLYGTGIAATPFLEFRLFYQVHEGTIVDMVYGKDGWTSGSHVFPEARPNTPIVAQSFGRTSRAYHVDPNEALIENATLSGEEIWTSKVLEKEHLIPGSNLGCDGYLDIDNNTETYIYLQDKEGTISEFFTYDDRTWETNPDILGAE